MTRKPDALFAQRSVVIGSYWSAFACVAMVQGIVPVYMGEACALDVNGGTSSQSCCGQSLDGHRRLVVVRFWRL